MRTGRGYTRRKLIEPVNPGTHYLCTIYGKQHEI